MAELRRAEKLASAKKKLKQFQQRNKDGQSESGRSTPSKKKQDEDPTTFMSENGGSTHSLSHSENPSSNISGTDSPVFAMDNSIDNLCQIFNGNSQPDILNLSTLPKVSEDLFQSSSPNSFFSETSPRPNTQSASDFFDNLSSGNDPPDGLSQESYPVHDVALAPNAALNVTVFHSPHVNASTPDGPLFQDTPNYSFPDASFSPIKDIKNNTSIEMVTKKLEMELKNSHAKNTELEQQLTEQKNQIIQLQSHLEEVKVKADEGASALKHHIQAIEILVSEKTELQNLLERRQEALDSKSGEVEELQGRLRASRKRVSDIERELANTKCHIASLEGSYNDLLRSQATLLAQSDIQGKRVGDLELEVSDLRSKLENRDQTLVTLRADWAEKTSQLNLAEVRIQQLSGGPESDGRLEEELRQKNEELLQTVRDLESQLHATNSTNDESMKDYQRYVNRLNSELQELKTAHETVKEQNLALTAREKQLVQQVSELERQLARAPQPAEDPALRGLRDELQLATDSITALQVQLQEKTSEVDVLREGLQERAARIQELEVTVERLETERPDTANLQAAIESDKVAASRAMAQNNNLKKQLEELQEALIKMSNNKLELTQQLQQEQHLSRGLTERLEQLQESKITEVEKSQQTENPSLQEFGSQTTNSHPVVSPEMMLKLEEKFRKTMTELADLSDEKQRLEHLVLQLQSETETIGEYIALYQIQRGMLRQRAQEKDEQVARLAEDKEALRNKLAQLNCLVQRLVGQGHHPQINGYETEPTQEPEKSNDASLSLTSESTSANVETAEQIRSLLTEIGSHNLVSSSGEHSNITFHPCPWCSGRLITV
uniref:Golgin subfamily A conserved domain-containing protein n=1 Tax=Cuerna arida TaxID=1464854 RepID=A0A1B6EI66_9HEMI